MLSGSQALKSVSHKHQDNNGSSEWPVFPEDGGTKGLLFHRHISRNSLLCLFKNKTRVPTGGEVACNSILKASFTDYNLRLLTSKRSHYGWIFFFFNAFAELLYNLFAWPWEAVRLKVGEEDRGIPIQC